MHERVEVADVETVRVVDESEHASPLLGVTNGERDTVPANPSVLVTVIVETAVALEAAMTL